MSNLYKNSLLAGSRVVDAPSYQEAWGRAPGEEIAHVVDNGHARCGHFPRQAFRSVDATTVPEVDRCIVCRGHRVDPRYRRADRRRVRR